MNKQELTKRLLVLLIILFIPIIVFAYDFEMDGICYDLNKSTQTLVVTYNINKKYSGHITIPESCTINGTTYPVTKIGSHAFLNSELTSIDLPNSIDTIEIEAFKSCKLTNIIIPNSVKVVGGRAFEYSSLENVVLSESLEYIDGYAFNGCKLTTVKIPNSVKEIGSHAFDMPSLRTAIIGTGVKKMSNPWTYHHQNREETVDVKVFWLSNTPPEGYQSALGSVNYVANELYETGWFRDVQIEWHKQYPIIKVYSFLSSMFTVDGIVYVPINPSEHTCEAIDCTYDSNISSVNIGSTVTFKSEFSFILYYHSRIPFIHRGLRGFLHLADDSTIVLSLET